MCHVQMQKAYDEYNDRVRATGKSRGHFMVDLCRPGHLTACLRNFQEATGCSDENWESQFGKALHRTPPCLCQKILLEKVRYCSSGMYFLRKSSPFVPDPHVHAQASCGQVQTW